MNWLAAVGAALVAALTYIFSEGGKRLAVGALTVGAFITAAISLKAALEVLVVNLIPSLPGWVMVWAFATPSNLPACLGVAVAADFAAWTYRVTVRSIGMRLGQ